MKHVGGKRRVRVIHPCTFNPGSPYECPGIQHGYRHINSAKCRLFYQRSHGATFSAAFQYCWKEPCGSSAPHHSSPCFCHAHILFYNTVCVYFRPLFDFLLFKQHVSLHHRVIFPELQLVGIAGILLRHIEEARTYMKAFLIRSYYIHKTGNRTYQQTKVI